jgi:PAS domain S-box-containing protein
MFANVRNGVPNMRQLTDTWVCAAIGDAMDGVLVEASGIIVYINETYTRLLGYPSTSELVGASVAKIIHASDRGQLDHFARCRREGRPAPAHFSFRVLRRDGTPLPVVASVSATHVPGQWLITTVVRPANEGCSESATAIPEELHRLSAREREVFDLLLGGVRQKEIALRLRISDKTVGTHASRMYGKLALRNQLDLFRFASHHGLIDAAVAAPAAAPAAGAHAT